jgi:hypothetical protein
LAKRYVASLDAKISTSVTGDLAAHLGDPLVVVLIAAAF